jgi:nitroimidazol reductase NimA-like FMN-containing flavoprotein (pyridoxamine 5'-phosphate oxidase superfamily)
MYYNSTPRSQIRRRPDRGSYERAQIEAILDEGFLCHVGLLGAGAPFVIPMVYGRAADTLYLHGSPASRLLKELPRAARACATVTLIDGLVLARSTRKHSLNYRSVVAFGTVSVISDAAEKRAALEKIVDHLLPGRSTEVRPATPNELATTNVVAFSIDEASAKSRSGPPLDDEQDDSPAIWAGEVPLQLSAGSPRADARSTRVPLPASLGDLFAERARQRRVA